MPPKPVRTSRIEARIAPDALKVIKRAAEIQAAALAISWSLPRKRSRPEQLRTHKSFGFQSRISAPFAEAVLNPPPPSIGLLKAAEAYRTLIKASR